MACAAGQGAIEVGRPVHVARRGATGAQCQAVPSASGAGHGSWCVWCMESGEPGCGWVWRAGKNEKNELVPTG
jgi:hypothetical protein